MVHGHDQGQYNYIIVINYCDLGVIVIDCKVRKCNVLASCALIDVTDSITTNYSKGIYMNIYSYKIKGQSYSYPASATSHHYN